jgi:surface protein
LITREELRDKILNNEDISGIDYSNITDMSYMFNNCISLVGIPLLDTSKVTDMSDMFFGCSELKEVPKFDTSKVIIMVGMFRDCSSLKHIPENFPLYDWSNTNSEILRENYPEYFIYV